MQAAIANLALRGRIALIGSITHYNAGEDGPIGPNNLFEIVAKEGLMQGFMTHMHDDRYEEVREQLQEWVAAGKLKSIEYALEGIENAGIAFCHLYEGRNFGKTVVKISDD